MSVAIDKWGDLMDIYEDPEFLKFLEKRYSALLNTVKKAIESAFEGVSIEQQIRLVSALLASSPPVYIKKDFLDLKTKSEIKLTEEKLREVLGGDFELFYLTSIRLKKALIPKQYLGEQKWNMISTKLKTLGFKWDKELDLFIEAF